MTLKIGILAGRENTFPQAFIDYVNGLGQADLAAEWCTLGGTRLGEVPEYRVIVDRISHEVPYYRVYLKNAVLQGTVVINDPFWWCADDKFFECCLAEKLGVAVPRTLALPNKDYVDGIVQESLRNLVAPLDWQGMLDYVGAPAILKPAIGGGWRNVYKVHNAEELVRCFDQSGQLQMIVQEFIDFQQYVRCICLGQTVIKVIPYDPHAPFERRYGSNPAYLTPELHERIVHDARTLNEALGYDMNTVEFAIRDGVPYAIDFLNPAPDFDRFSIGPANFEWVLEHMAQLVIAYARGDALPGRAAGAPASLPGHDYRWARVLDARGGGGMLAAAGAAAAGLGATVADAVAAVGTVRKGTRAKKTKKAAAEGQSEA